MEISATEFKTNFGKYLAMAGQHEIYITKKGRAVAKLSSPTQDRVAMLDSLVGIAENQTLSLDELREERLSRQ